LNVYEITHTCKT